MVHPVPVAEPLWCPDQTRPALPWASTPFRTHTWRRWLWATSARPCFETEWGGGRWATPGKRLTGFVGSRQRRWCGVSAPGWEEAWIVWNEIYLPSTQSPGPPPKTPATGWLIGTETLPGQGQRGYDLPHFTDCWQTGLLAFTLWILLDIFPPSCSPDSRKALCGLAALDKLSVARGRETTSALNVTQLIGPEEVNYVERGAVCDSCHIYHLSKRDTKSDHSLLINLLWPLDLWAITNRILAGCPEDMKTFCENIWHSLSQEKEGEKKKSQALGQNFIFFSCCHVGEGALSVFKQMCVWGGGGKVGGGMWAPFQVLKGA